MTKLINLNCSTALNMTTNSYPLDCVSIGTYKAGNISVLNVQVGVRLSFVTCQLTVSYSQSLALGREILPTIKTQNPAIIAITYLRIIVGSSILQTNS